MNSSISAKVETTILSIDGGIEVELLNYGATLKSIKVPVAGEMIDILLQYEQDEDYLGDIAYVGATLGRYAGRIDLGKTNIAGKPVSLYQNEKDTGHCLHGGSSGFSHQYWSLVEQTEILVAYEYWSADGEQGFPGNLKTRVEYKLVGPTTLQIEFTAETDQETCINLSNHAYFNLNQHSKSIANHELWINSDLYTPVGDNRLPTGEVLEVEDTVFDFRAATRLEERLNGEDPQLLLCGGYDHYFLLNHDMQTPTISAILHSPESGITMKMFSDQPGVVLYTGNWLSDPFESNEGLCLEFQHIPNAPNLPWFYSTTLQQGEQFRRQIRLEFEV